MVVGRRYVVGRHIVCHWSCNACIMQALFLEEGEVRAQQEDNRNVDGEEEGVPVLVLWSK